MPKQITIPYEFEPRPYQKEFFQQMDSGYKRGILLMHRRCLGANTRISMFNGSFKLIHQLEIGDEILSFDWRFKEVRKGYVEDVWFTGKKPGYLFECGSSRVVSSLDHKFFDIMGNKIPLKDIDEGDVLAMSEGVGANHQIIDYIGEVDMWDICVSPHHCFYANGFLTANSGKDKTFFNFLIKKAFQRVGVYYYFFPEYAQGRRVIWDGIDGSGMKFLDHIPQQLILKKNGTEMKIELTNGSMIQIIGTDKFNKVRGANPVGCCFSEMAYQNPAAWDVIRPILVENGGWAVFNTTSNGKNHFHKLWEMAKNNPKWYTKNITVEDSLDPEGNRYVTEEMVQSERDAGMSEETIQQEFYNSFTANAEGYYYLKFIEAAEKEGRVCNVPYTPNIPVDTWWDIGVSDDTAIWFTQTVGRALHVIKSYSSRGKSMVDYVDVLNKMPYTYGTHTFPHDMKQTEFGSGRTKLEIAYELFANDRVDILPRSSIDDGINAARVVIPSCYFDSRECFKGLDALRNYQREWDSNALTFKSKPKHDHTSHYADAFRYLACGFALPRIKKRKSMLSNYRNTSIRGWMSV